jgi:hypothetical protein
MFERLQLWLVLVVVLVLEFLNLNKSEDEKERSGGLRVFAATALLKTPLKMEFILGLVWAPEQALQLFLRHRQVVKLLAALAGDADGRTGGFGEPQ